jgi:hypothetical protein
MDMSPEERIAKLEAELAKEKAKNTKTPQIVISQKKCVQINNIRRFPFTFYKRELDIILSMKDELEEFMKVHDSSLA